MSTLITGTTGFLGSHLRTALEKDGVPVVCLIRDCPPLGVYDDASALVFGDVTDAAVCRRILADYEVDTIYHLAAQAIVSVCGEDPVTAIKIAVMGTANILQAVRETGRKVRVVVSISDKAYGHAPSPYTEETPFDPRYAYEVSKACQDMVARMFFYNFGVDVRVVRAVNIYGPGDPNESRLIPQTARRLLRGEPPLLHAGASTMRRQFIYVDDMVRALRVIAEKGSSGEAYCVGSADPPIDVEGLMRLMAEIAGVPWAPPVVKDRDARFQEIQSQAVIDKKLRGLGWEPEIPLAAGLRETLDWYRRGN